jgi:hypothetical protein
MAQPAEPTPTPPGGGEGPTIDIHLDLSGLAELIWRWLIDHIGELGWAVWLPLEQTLRAAAQAAAQAIWDAAWNSTANIITQLPPDLTYNFGPYRAVAVDPTALAIGGAMLAVVLLGLRTMLGSIVGQDHMVSHILGRLVPAVFLTLAYPVLIARGVGLLNQVATSLGSGPIGAALVPSLPPPPVPHLAIPWVVLWLLLIYYAIRLLIRLAYSIFRFLVALLFGPVALILWAIPQTEWITRLWIGELLGWGTTPLLVTACLALALPMASGREGFLGAAVFGIAGMQAAYDLVGLLAFGRARGGSLFPVPYAAIRGGVAAATGGAGAGVAAASIPANRMTTLADQYGYQ